MNEPLAQRMLDLIYQDTQVRRKHSELALALLSIE